MILSPPLISYIRSICILHTTRTYLSFAGVQVGYNNTRRMHIDIGTCPLFERPTSHQHPVVYKFLLHIRYNIRSIGIGYIYCWFDNSTEMTSTERWKWKLLMLMLLRLDKGTHQQVGSRANSLSHYHQSSHNHHHNQWQTR